MKRISTIIAAALLTITAVAQPPMRPAPKPSSIVLPDLLKGEIVLQQQTNARIWGKATPGSKVTVSTSWNGANYNVTAAKDSLWDVKVATPDASFTPYEVTIASGKDQVVLKNVLIGDVWFCGGQSNMTMPMKGMFNCYVEGAAEDIAMAGQYKGLRYVTVGQNKFNESHPEYFTEGIWYPSNPGTAPDITATGFYFGSTLNKALDIPIGLISCNWSGSFVEDWFNKELLEKYPDQKVFGAEFTKAYTTMYYGMLEPASKYTIKGMIWYQGESNVGSPNYTERLAAAVELWKSKFELKEMPFYIVELAPWKYNQGFEDKCPYLREQQWKASKVIPNSGLVSTNDLVYEFEGNMIHPAQKKQVGQRLAYLALSKAYGYGNPCEGPEYDDMEIMEDGSIVVGFKNAENGFMVRGEIKGFEIAGEDGVFYPAKAVTAFKRPRNMNARETMGGFGRGGYAIKVSSEQVKNPVAVRYAFRDFLFGNLCSTEGFPVVPFRTDNWDK